MSSDLWARLNEEIYTMEIPADAPLFAREKLAFALGLPIEAEGITGWIKMNGSPSWAPEICYRIRRKKTVWQWLWKRYGSGCFECTLYAENESRARALISDICVLGSRIEESRMEIDV